MTKTQEWVDDFLVVSNQPALDLLNTSLVLDAAPVELLPDVAALKRWLIAAGIIVTPRLKAALGEWSGSEEAGAFLREIIAFRERLRAAVGKLESGKVPGSAFLEELNELLHAHPMRTAITVKKGKLNQEQALRASMADNLWAVLAAETAALFTQVQPSRVRQCENCIVHFYDVSKKGSRRWCSMNLCGNRKKVAAYRRRRRADDH